MTCLGTVAIPAECLALSDAFDELSDVRANLEETAGTAQGAAASLWITGPSKEAVQTVLEGADSVRHVDQLAEREDEWLYDIEFDASMTVLRRIVFFYDGTILDGAIEAGTWTFDLRFQTRDDFSGAVDDLRDHGFEVNVERVQSLDQEALDRVAETLTEKQYELLSAALEGGYFDVPRGTSLEELGTKFDVSQQSTSEMMRRAQRTIVAAAVDGTTTEAARGNSTSHS